METLTELFNLIETGKGSAAVAGFCEAETTFVCQAVDVLPGPKCTECKTIAAYADWMAGVVTNFGDKATFTIDASAFDDANKTALFSATFGGFSHYVYTFVVGESGKVKSMTKVWNDAYTAQVMAAGAPAAMEVVQSCYATWGAGGFSPSNPDAPATTSNLVSPGVVCDCSGTATNSDMWKHYSGVEGWIEFVGRLEEAEWNDMDLDFIKGPSPDSVYVRFTSTPKCIKTGKVAAAPLTDMQLWKCEAGKVTSFKLFHGDLKTLDELWA